MFLTRLSWDITAVHIAKCFVGRNEVLRINLFITRSLTNTELISCQQSAGDKAFPLLLIDFSLHIFISNTKTLQWEKNGHWKMSVLCDMQFF